MSTDHEEQQSSFENQVKYYTEYINERPDYEMAGIYADEGITATNTKKREGFKRLIADCDAGKIDLVITKSISRFARNTQDCLQYSRHLKNLGIGIIFEKENINTLDAAGELLFTILSSLAQEESRNISENSKWGIKRNFQNGKPTLAYKRFLGYDRGPDGKLVINEEQAKIVRRIFTMFEEGYLINQIAHTLREEGVEGTMSNAWHYSTINHMLHQEKYCGDLLMQKTYTVDYLSKKRIINDGAVDQYFVENDHEAIIPKEEWQAVQLELERREKYRAEIGIGNLGHGLGCFTGRVLCGKCGKMCGRKGPDRYGRHFWMCNNKMRSKGASCNNDNILEEDLMRGFRIAWNSLVQDEKQIKRWDDMLENGNPLEKLRARQMKLMAEEGPITFVADEHVMLVTERVILKDKTHIEVRFLDGSIKNVCLGE